MNVLPPACMYELQRSTATYYLLSINNVELSITNGETAPPHHPVCRCDTTPEDEQLKDKDHAWTNVWSGRTHCKHTLVNLNSENKNTYQHTNIIIKYSQLSRKRLPLGHDKVVTYGRWSLMGKINKISLHVILD